MSERPEEEEQQRAPRETPRAGAATVVSVVTIRGMLAVHAVRAVFTALAGVDGIVRAEVELGRATVEHDGRATPERLRDAIALAGCEVERVVEEKGRRLPVV